MTAKDVARLIDISAVKTQNSLKDIEKAVMYAKQYRFINVHSLPCWTKKLSEMLKNEPDIFVGAPVGFPSGAHTTETKIFEAKQLVKDGADELDIVINVGKLKNREYNYVLEELLQIQEVIPKTKKTKVIIEINALTDYEMEKACEIVLKTKADFIKTGTGWIPGKINIERIARIKEIASDKIKVKASGGIRTKEEFEALLQLGVERFGINMISAIDIVHSFDNNSL